MKIFYVLLIVAPILLSCEDNKTDVSVTWELVSNSYSGKSENLSRLIFENQGQKALNDNWRFYFNYPRSIDTTSVCGGVSVRHINGDFYQLAPNADWQPLHTGDSIAISLISKFWNISKTDAPAGGYFVFDAEDNSAVECKIKVVDFLREEQTKRSAADNVEVETELMRYMSNSNLQKLNSHCPIIPTPKIYELKDGVCKIDNDVEVMCDGQELRAETDYLINELGQLLDSQSESQGLCKIMLKQVPSLETLYVLDIKPDIILILGRDTEGVFNGIQSLLSMMPVEAYKTKQSLIELQCVHVADMPQLAHRGLMLDVGRNFQTKDEILKTLDLMARYKLNKFHFHFCDDEGWRLQIKDLPELVDYGSVRKHEGYDKTNLPPSFGSGAFESASGTGYYTETDFVEILKYAKMRHIEVIPEIDVPGHSRAAIKSMEYRYHKYMEAGDSIKAVEYLLTDFQDKSQYSSVQGWTDNVMCIASDATYRFFSTVLNAIESSYKEAGLELKNIHVGGDEVPHGAWLKSPKVQEFAKQNNIELDTDALFHYFMARLCDTLNNKGITMSGWEEIAVANDEVKGKIVAPEMLDKDIVPYVWNTVGGWGAEDLAYKLANAGIDVVMSSASNLYFDLAYTKDPEEPGYYWAEFNDTKKAWEFTPYDVSKCVNKTPLGDPINWDVDRNMVQLTEKGRGHIRGIQGQLWAENLKSAELLEYCMLPKMLGLAERAWCGQPEWIGADDAKQREWSDFVGRLGMYVLPKLDYINGGYLYRIPPVGAMVDNARMVHLNVLYSGLAIRYTTDGTEPNADSKLYSEPIDFVAGIKAAAFDSRGRSGRVVILK